MERVTKSELNELIKDSRYLLYFTDYKGFKEIENQTPIVGVSLYDEVYNIDDCFQDNVFVVVVKKSSLVGALKEVELVEKPENEFQKNTDDFSEFKLVDERVVDAVFYWVR